MQRQRRPQSRPVHSRKGAAGPIHKAAICLVVPTLIGVLLSAIVSIVPAGAIGNGRFSIAPVSANVGGRTVFTPLLSPGVVAKDTVVVINETTQPITLALYAADAYNTQSGGFALRPAAATQQRMGKWIHLSVTKVTVAPKSADVIGFTVDPPPNIGPGNYSGGIVAVDTKATVTTKKSTVKVKALQAVGVTVYGKVRGTLLPRLAVTNVKVATSSPFASQFGGSVDATVTYSITNTGNQNLTPTVTIKLSPLLGSGQSVKTSLRRFLPGSTVTLSHVFKGVTPYGSLTAKVSVGALTATATGGSASVVIPWGVVAVLLALGAFWYWLRRRRKGARPTKKPVRPAAAPSSAATTVASVGGGRAR